MEAISAGSSAAFKPTAPESQYEPVTPIPEGEMYSYARTARSQERTHQVQERKELKSLYDDPDAPVTIQALIPGQNQPTARDTPTSHLEQPSHPKARRARSKSPSTTERYVPDSQKATKFPASRVYMTISDDKEQYDVVDATASTDPIIEEYVDVDMESEVEQENPSFQARSPRRSVTFPSELSALAEISIEDLSNLDPDEAQLWMLNQMQKLVQNFAGIYESTAVGPLPKSNRGKVLPLQDVKEVYNNVQLEQPHQKESPTASRKITRQTKTAYVASTSSTSSKLLAAERSPRHQSAAAYIHRPQIKPKPVSSGNLNLSSLLYFSSPFSVTLSLHVRKSEKRKREPGNGAEV